MLELKGEEVRIDFGKAFHAEPREASPVAFPSCLAQASDSHCCHMKIITSKVFTDAKCKPSFFHWREQPHHALLKSLA